jgi:uncharacterized protein DUF4214
MKFAVALLITAFAALTVWGQAPPTLHIVTEIPNLPSDLYYGNTKVKPLRLRPGTNTPITINDADFFVNQQYVDFLSRFPDQSGFDFWTNQITACGANATCVDGLRTNTSGAFFLSIEFQETGYLVERMYKVAYGDAQAQSTDGGAHPILVPFVRRSDFLHDQLEVGQGVVVNKTGWEALLESNKVAYANDFVSRSTFTSAYPANMSNATFVSTLNNNAGGNILSSAEQTNLVNGLNAGTMTRAQVVRAVAEDQDLNAAEKNKAFVLMQYFGYLRRDPNSGPDTDYSGYDFWLKKLNAHGGDFHAAEMVRSFLVASEYLNRF